MLASLNLPAAIEDLSGNAVPSSLLEKSAKVRELGGVEKLSKLMSDLPELLTRNREILDEVSQKSGKLLSGVRFSSGLLWPLSPAFSKQTD